MKKKSSRMCMCNECELTFSIVCSTCNIKNKTITTTTSTSKRKLNKRYRYSNAILNDSDDKENSTVAKSWSTSWNYWNSNPLLVYLQVSTSTECFGCS